MKEEDIFSEKVSDSDVTATIEKQVQEDGQPDEIDYLADFSAPITRPTQFIDMKLCGEIGSDFLNLTETDSQVLPSTQHATPEEGQIGNSKFGKKIKPQLPEESESFSDDSSMRSLQE